MDIKEIREQCNVYKEIDKIERDKLMNTFTYKTLRWRVHIPCTSRNDGEKVDDEWKNPFYLADMLDYIDELSDKYYGKKSDKCVIDKVFYEFDREFPEQFIELIIKELEYDDDAGHYSLDMKVIEKKIE